MNETFEGKRIASGMVMLLEDTIVQAIKRDGEPPKRIELHPAAFLMLAKEISPAMRFDFATHHTDRKPTFRGIHIAPDAIANRVISARNESSPL